MKTAVSSYSIKQKSYSGMINPLKKVIVRKYKNGYNVEAVLDGLEDDNYKVIVSNGIINIMMAIPKFSNYITMTKYYIVGRSSIMIPESEYNTISSIQNSNGILKMRLIRSGIKQK